MIKNVYVVYDKLAEEYSDPISIKNDALANRFFVQELKKVPNRDDYIIYWVGSYDTDTSDLDTFEKEELELDFSSLEVDE